MARQVSFGGGLIETPEPRYMRQRAMADALMQGTQGPISGWGEGVANLAKTAAAGFINRRAGEAEKTETKARADLLRQAHESGDFFGTLGQSDDPWAQGMTAQYAMARALEGPDNELVQAVGPDGSMTWVPKSQAAGMQSALPDAFKPNVQEFFENGQRVKGYLDAQGNLVKVGDSAPMFAPQQGPQDPERVRLAKEAGLVPGTLEYQDFLLNRGKDSADPLKQENILRDEFNALTKDFRTVQDAYSKIESTSASGAGDMSMLYSYVKLLDPGSVVRESEFATAAASGSFGEQVQGAVSHLMTGERLPDSLRAAFKNEAKSIFQAQKAGYDRLKTSYGNLATRTNVPAENVIVDYAAPEAAPVDLGTRGGQPVTPDIGFQNAPQIGEGTVIVNPQTKERMVMKGGQWVPAP